MKKLRITTLLLSEIATRLTLVETPCTDCDGTGRETKVVANRYTIHNRHDFDEIRRRCGTCFGRGIMQIEVCSVCLQDESGCEADCSPVADLAQCKPADVIQIVDEIYERRLAIAA